MKTQLSSLDIFFISKELLHLVGTRIDQIYQIGKREIKISLRGDGKRELIVAPNYLCITRFEYKAPKKPGNFAMLLRKHLNGGIIRGVAQHGFDRIVEFEIRGRGKLIVELFSRGNIILLDENNRITAILESQEWKDRTLKPGLPYVYPPEMPDVKSMSADDFALVLGRRSEVVKALASDLGLGATYANEILKRAGIHPKECADRKKAGKLYRVLKDVLSSEINAGIIRAGIDNKLEDVVPIDMMVYAGLEREEKPSFNEAVDEYFSQLRIGEEGMAAAGEYNAEIRRLEKVIENQKKTLEEMSRKAEEYKRMGDLVYTSFQQIEEVLDGIKAAKADGKNWVEYSQEKGIRVIDPAMRRIEVGGVAISIDKSVSENAAFYYEKAKKAKSKLSGVKKALKESEMKLKLVREKKVREEEKMPRKPVEKPKPKWYEKFRWFISSDGFLVIGGKDATSNEMIIKRHMEPDDLVFHSTVHGAPFFIIKNPEGKEIPESTKRQAAEAAASYSNAWKAGWGSADVYAVRPEQVSKTAQSGEYLTKGAFVIRGEREWFKATPLRLAIGFIVGDYATVIGGPEDAVKSRTRYYVVIDAGDMKSGQLAREIKANILRKTNKEDGQKIKRLDLGDIQRWIPAGRGAIAR